MSTRYRCSLKHGPRLSALCNELCWSGECRRMTRDFPSPQKISSRRRGAIVFPREPWCPCNFLLSRAQKIVEIRLCIRRVTMYKFTILCRIRACVFIRRFRHRGLWTSGDRRRAMGTKEVLPVKNQGYFRHFFWGGLTETSRILLNFIESIKNLWKISRKLLAGLKK